MLGDVLHDHVDVDVVFRQRTEECGGNAGAVGDPNQRDLGLVACIRDAADDLLFHDFSFVDHKRSRRVGKGRAHPEADPVVHGDFNRAGIQDLGALRGHLEHFLVGDPVELACPGDDTGIAGVDAVDIGVDVAARGAKGGG